LAALGRLEVVLASVTEAIEILGQLQIEHPGAFSEPLQSASLTFACVMHDVGRDDQEIQQHPHAAMRTGLRRGSRAQLVVLLGAVHEGRVSTRRHRIGRCSGVVCRLANPVAPCDCQAVFFLAASGQIRMAANSPTPRRRRPRGRGQRAIVMSNSGVARTFNDFAPPPPLSVIVSSIILSGTGQSSPGRRQRWLSCLLGSHIRMRTSLPRRRFGRPGTDPTRSGRSP
jgi:hypothetical protein